MSDYIASIRRSGWDAVRSRLPNLDVKSHQASAMLAASGALTNHSKLDLRGRGGTAESNLTVSKGN